MVDTTERFVGKGLAGFIRKPYNPDTLRETLAELLGDGGGEIEEGS